jgi:TolA-binding protein
VRALYASLLLLPAALARAEAAPVSTAPTPAQRAARERSVAAEPREGAGGKLDLAPPENLESRIFLSDRPPERADSRKRREAALLERMLEEREQLVKVRREQAIAQLTRFVEHEPERSSYMADALLRLAELRWEQARIDYLAAFEAWQHAPESSRSKEAPKPNIDVPLALYERILTQHREFDRYDLVLYMQAYALVEAGRTREALFAYRRIIDEFPESRFVPDAHMAFAEWHFGGSYDYKAALEEYEEVRKHPESELSDLALFKSAWCLWKLGKSQDAALRFRQVLDLSGSLEHVTGERRRRLLELQDEALEYLIQVFTEDESNTAADLHGFLSEIGGEKYANKVLRRLSRAFFDQARYERAVQAYSMLLESEADSPQAPEYQSQIAAAYAAQDDADGTIAALTQLAKAYKPGSTWATRQADPEVGKRAALMAERSVRVQAMRFHERGQKEKQPKDFERAAALYQLHIDEFPDSVFNYEVGFYLGEILFHRLGRYDDAGRAYLRAAKLRPAGELTRDALYNAIIAFEKVRVAELDTCKPESAPAPKPEAPAPPQKPDTAQAPAPAAAAAAPASACRETDTDRNFSEAIALYIQLYPKDPEVPGILFRQGRMYFERGIYDPAVRQFGQLLDSYPNSEYAASAGELVLESFNRAHDYSNIETWARKLKGAPAFQTADAQRKLDALILQSVFKAGESLAEKGEHDNAAQAYLKAAREFPKDERAPKAYVNAGLQYQLAGSLEPAAEAYNELIAQHPGSNEGAIGAWNAAQMFEAIAQFRDAAHYYEAYAEFFPRGDKRADALYNAVVLRVAAGDYDEAAKAGQRYTEAFPRSDTTDEVQFMVGRAHEAKQRWDAAAQVYREYARKGKNADRRIEANTRLGQVLQKRGDARGADRALKDAVAAGKHNPAQLREGRYFAAQARFMQGDQVLAEFEQIEIGGDGGSLKKRLDQKSELLRKAAVIYGEVVEFQVAEWVTAALYKIGRSYELFAESLRSAPMPDGLNEAQQQAYRDQLAMFIVPIEERALEAYEGGYKKAVELHVFNHWTQMLREGLTRLNQVQYPPLREIGADIASGYELPAPAPYASLQRQQPAAAPAAAATGAAKSPAQSKARKQNQKAKSRGAR